MVELVKYIVSNLVENKDKVEVSSRVDGDVNVIDVFVAGNEIGRVIGKNGKIASSIRAIVKTIGNKSGAKYAIKIGSKDEDQGANE